MIQDQELLLKQVAELAERTKKELEAIEAQFHQSLKSEAARIKADDAGTPAAITKKTMEFNRWAAISRTHLQQGFMALSRAITQPTTF